MLHLHERARLHWTGRAEARIDWDADTLLTRVDTLAQTLSKLPSGEVLALAGDNHPDWIVADLACALSGHAVVPIPGFFTAQQTGHVCTQARLRHVLHRGQVLPLSAVWPQLAGQLEYLTDAPENAAAVGLPDGTQKITFTSGTTGQAKGICLTWDQQMETARALVDSLSALNIRVHLNLLPLSVLLENIAGVYAPLMMGARVVSLNLADVGLSGSSVFDPAVCAQAIASHGAESVILLPQMLQALVAWVGADAQRRHLLDRLRFVAVGGAATPKATLDKAHQMGLPVFEGYGLTECASVVCLNTPTADCPGTVGTPLPGLDVGLADDGEIWVEGRSHAGVLGQPLQAGQSHAGRVYTGDLGHWIGQDGKRFLHITGRKKNILITSFGRNVSPEWPERLLMDTGLFAQAVVMGDGLSQLRAAVVPLTAGISGEQVRCAVQSVNQALPDYAQMGAYLICTDAFTPANGLATPNGRPLRQRIEQHCAAQFARGTSGV